MIDLLAKLVIKDKYQTDAEGQRRAYGILCSWVGVGLNVLLFAGKYVAGLFSGSIAIVADAFNNLSDAGSSIITLIGFRLAGKKPDPDHPFGHGRIEYLSGLAVSAIILMMGLGLARSSLDKILRPEAVDSSPLVVAILLVSIGVKLYMFWYNRSIGRRIDSAGMKATAIDSLSDAVATSVVLLTMLITHFSGWNADGWGGMLVSLFILYAGFNAARETLSPLLGQPPRAELIQRIENIVLSHDEVIGIHDLVVHDYGPGRMMISLHAEVPGSGDIFVLHDAIDRIEQQLNEELNCESIIHMDPITDDHESVSRIRIWVAELVREQISPQISIHDFRMVAGPTHTNLIFDAVVPYGLKPSDQEIRERICELIRREDRSYIPVVKIDKPYA